MSVSPSVLRDDAGASMESFTRWRTRRNGLGNVMQGVRPHQLRRLGAGLNHVVEHDRHYESDRESVDTAIEEPIAAPNAVESSAENHYGLAAVLGFPLSASGQTGELLSSSATSHGVEDDLITTNCQFQVESGYSSEETERILRSPTHKRRRNALPDAFEGLDEDTIDRIRLLHAASQESSHDRW